MAQVTIELRHLLQTDFELFDFNYVISDTVWKAELEKAIIDYYLFEEIGQETPERFKHVFKTKFLSLIPHYDRLYQLNQQALLDGLINSKMTESIEGELVNSGEDNSNSSSTQDVLNTEYPQHTSIVDDIPSGRSVNNGTSSVSVNFGKVETKTHEKIISGYSGITSVELVTKYKNNLLRINGQIIQELKSCFILVY